MDKWERTLHALTPRSQLGQHRAIIDGHLSYFHNGRRSTSGSAATMMPAAAAATTAANLDQLGMPASGASGAVLETDAAAGVSATAKLKPIESRHDNGA
jgi:hypothetical protein